MGDIERLYNIFINFQKRDNILHIQGNIVYSRGWLRNILSVRL